MVKTYFAPCGSEEDLDPCIECGCAPAIDTRPCGYSCGMATQCMVAAVLARRECVHVDCEHHPNNRIGL